MKNFIFLLLSFSIFAQNNGSLSFNGSSAMGYYDVTDFGSTLTAGVFSCWIKPTDTDNFDTFFGKGENSVTSRFLRFRFFGNYIEVNQRNADTETAVQFNTTTISTGVWTHVVIISTGTAYSCYINGVLQNNNVRGGSDNGDWFADTDTGDNITFGTTYNGGAGANWYNGLIDEVALFNTASVDVAELYNNGTPKDLTGMTGLINYWRFEEGSGATAADQTGNADMALTNAAFSTDTPGWDAGTVGSNRWLGFGDSWFGW